MTTKRAGGIFDGCLLLSDIDGTLVSKGEIPERNIKAVKYFMDHGGLFSIATGRSIEATRQYAEKSHANAGIVTFNGAVIYDFAYEKTIVSNFLPESAKELLMPLVEKFPLVGAEVHSVRELYVVNKTTATDEHIEYEKIFPLELTVEEIFAKPWTKVLFGCLEPDEMNRFHAYCEKLELSGCYFLKTADVYYELTCGGVNKGTALRALAEHYGIAQENVFAIGDYYNDTEMLSEAGLSAVAAGAPDDLKRSVDFVAGSCEGGCVADFIDYLTLKLQD